MELLKELCLVGGLLIEFICVAYAAIVVIDAILEVRERYK